MGKSGSKHEPLPKPDWWTLDRAVPTPVPSDTIAKLRKDADCFSVLTYNVLAEAYAAPANYPWLANGSEALLHTPVRHVQLAKQLKLHAADIVCLQEVMGTYYAELLVPMFSEQGYDAFYVRKTGDVDEGVVVAWRLAKFVLVEPCQAIEVNRLAESFAMEHHLDAERSRLLSDGVAVHVLLHFVGRPERAVRLLNLHGYWNWFAPDVQTIQLALLLEAVAARVRDDPTEYLVIAGDFNVTPQSPGYELLTSGRVHSADARAVLLDVNPVYVDWAARARAQAAASVATAGTGAGADVGAKAGAGAGASEAHEARAADADAASVTRLATASEARAATPATGEAASAAAASSATASSALASSAGEALDAAAAPVATATVPKTTAAPAATTALPDSPYVKLYDHAAACFSHGLAPLVSAHVLARGAEPTCTNKTERFCNTLDYVFVRPHQLSVEAVAGVPEPDDVLVGAGGPNAVFPSDHFVVHAILRCKHDDAADASAS